MDQQQAQDLARILAIGGAALGASCGVLGALAGVLAPRGKGKAIVIGGMFVMVAIGVSSLVTGAVVAFGGAPYIVYYPLLLIGFVLSVVTGPLIPVVRRRYREADVRRLEAAALRHS